MKPIYKKSLIGLAILVFMGLTYYLSLYFFKEKEKYYEVAQKSQFTGYWQMVQWNDEMKKQNKVNPWPLPYQWFGIYDDGHFYSYMTDKESKISSKELETIFKSITGNVTYTYDKGIMTMSYKGISNYREVWAVTVVTKKHIEKGVEFLPGDLIMSLANEKGETQYYRHLRKVN